MSTFSGKITGRKVSQVTGSVIYDIQVEVPGATKNDPVTTKTFKAQLSVAQLGTYKLMEEPIPTVGKTVTVEQSANPTTGEVSKDWVTLCA